MTSPPLQPREPVPPVPPGSVAAAVPVSGADQASGRLWRGFSLTRTFSALRYPNYRLWFAGQLASLVGSWMQTTAQGFLVYELTHSPAYLGYVGFANGVPSWLFMLYGGVVSDRLPRRKLLIMTQSASMVLAFILTFLTASGMIQPWHILILAFGTGVVVAFDAPARHSFVLEMVGRDDLSNAVALNSTMFNLATAIGPAVAGLLYVAAGPSWCFGINGISFLAVIAALLMMRLPPPTPRRPASALADLREGIVYAFRHPVIRLLILIALVISLFGMSFVILIPAWAVNVLHGDAGTNGILQSARGAGSLLGALSIASLGRFRFKGKLLIFGMFLFPLFMCGFAAARWLPLAVAAIVLTGWSVMLQYNMLNTLIQSQVADELRGRVMGIYTLTFFGSVPLGALLAGQIAERWGEPFTVVAGSTGCLLFIILLVWRRPLVYRLE